MRRRMERWKLAWSTVLYGSLVVVLMAKAASPEPNAAAQASAAAARAESDLRSVLEATPDPRKGMKFFQICAECHGPRGAGESSGWPPEIAGQHPRVIAKELTDFRSGLRWYDPMQIIAGRHVLHTTQDIADVAAYVGALPPSTDTPRGAAKNLEPGGRMYASRCQWCHGAKGEGSDRDFVPRVAGQHYEYLLRQLQDTIGGRRPNMRAQHIQLLEGARMEDLAGLAGYMSRLGSSTGQPLETGHHEDIRTPAIGCTAALLVTRKSAHLNTVLGWDLPVHGGQALAEP